MKNILFLALSLTALLCVVGCNQDADAGDPPPLPADGSGPAGDTAGQVEGVSID